MNILIIALPQFLSISAGLIIVILIMVADYLEIEKYDAV